MSFSLVESTELVMAMSRNNKKKTTPFVAVDGVTLVTCMILTLTVQRLIQAGY